MLILGLKQILRREEFIALLQALFSMLAITSLTCIVHSGGGLGSQKGVNVVQEGFIGRIIIFRPLCFQQTKAMPVRRQKLRIYYIKL